MTSRRSQQPQPLTLPSGCRAVYRDWGRGRPLVFLHGLMGNHRHWLGLMQILKRNYRCIAIDLLGFGDSSQPIKDCNIATEVAFVEEVIGALELQDFVLVGHSLGGWIAATYALNHRERMQGLVLVAPAGIRDRAFKPYYYYRLPLTWKRRWVDWSLAASAKFLDMFGQRDRLIPLLLERQALLNQSIARQFVRARIRGDLSEAILETALHTIDIPTLVIAAERDRLIPLWHCETYAKHIPEAQLCVLSNTTHRLPIDHWRDMLPPMQSFLKIFPAT